MSEAYQGQYLVVKGFLIGPCIQLFEERISPCGALRTGEGKEGLGQLAAQKLSVDIQQQLLDPSSGEEGSSRNDLSVNHKGRKSYIT
jgi:hypothetical protein